MSIKKNNLIFWLAVLIIIAGEAVIVWSLLSNSTNLTVELIGWITGAAIPVIAFLYSQIQKRSLGFFLFSHKLKSLISSRTLTWDLDASLSGENISSETLEQIVQKLTPHNGNVSSSAKIKQVHKNNVIIDIPSGPSLDIAYTPSTSSIAEEHREGQLPNLHISIRHYRVGYLQASRAIKREIVPVLESISSVVQASTTKYSFNIEFDKKQNPFFGLYIAHIPPGVVSNFYIRLVLNDSDTKGTVLISESKISINTYSQNALQNLALEFLAYDSRLQEHLSNA